MKPYYEHGGITIYHGDCREVLPTLPKADLVLTDPPYNGVVEEEWDNQWANDTDFLEWLSGVMGHIEPLLADNGTLYTFSSPRLNARVEGVVATHFRVIASAVWDKGDGRQGVAGTGIDVTALRTYWSSGTERLTVAEKLVNAVFNTADDAARDASGYWSACESLKTSIIGDYLRGEFRRAGVSNKQIAALFPSRTGGVTGCVSNWLSGANFPTAIQYAAMRGFLNGDGGDYLRREYEDLRRPFFLTAADQWGEVWRFDPPRQRAHPTQKPLALMSQIVRVSSRPANLVLDPFMGSGTTLRAAKDLGRRAIGIELEERYCEIAARRLDQEVLL